MDLITIFKLINSFLNLDLLYYKLVNIVKLSIRYKINKSNNIIYKYDLKFEDVIS